MTAKIEIGIALDGAVSRPPITALGALTVGPQRFLSWLESQLGLVLPEVPNATRVLQYLQCLRECDESQRFWHQSLRQDALGVARELLRWRDTWYEAGWRGDAFIPAAPVRLRDMTAVEKFAAVKVAPGIGQRVQRALAVLGQIDLDIELTLLDAPTYFPKVWQELFVALNAVPKPLPLEPHGLAGSDLQILQAALLNPVPDKKVQLKGDGSVWVLHDGSKQLSAPWIARYAHGLLATKESVVVLAPDGGMILDDALGTAGYPRLGFNAASPWRPVLQVLPLALEILWQPLDPGFLLQFLSHPVAPLPSRLRRRLAEVVANEPGIGGETWKATISDYITELEANDEGTAKERGAQLRADVAFWLDCERYVPAAGAPLKALLARLARLSKWLGTMLALQDDDSVAALYAAALSDTDELHSLVETLGISGAATITRDNLRQLVKSVCGNGVTRPGRQRQCELHAAQLQKADAPAGVIAPAAAVIWWGCDAESLPGAYPWSRAEQQSLTASGVELLGLDKQLEWQAAAWLRPILAAQEQLVLVLHEDADGHHPVFDQVLAVAEGWQDVRIDKLLREPSTATRALPRSETLPAMPLPAKQRWWQIPKEAAPVLRKQESYSSLEKFLYGPNQWVLNYAAKIRPGALAELSDDYLLKGSLAHRLFEHYFSANPDIASLDPDAAAQWARAYLPAMLAEVGAVLLTPGRQAEKEDFIDTACSALKQLVVQLQSANVVSVEMEGAQDGRFIGGKLGGIIDLLAVNASGDVAVIDIKWGGLNFRKNSLRKSEYLQLAVYAALCEQNSGRWPALGYFIIDGGGLLCLDTDYFPDGEVIRPENGESIAAFWERVAQTWKWRKAQLDQGLIEVPVDGTVPDADSTPGERGLVLPDNYDGFSDYTVLTGWGADQ